MIDSQNARIHMKNPRTQSIESDDGKFLLSIERGKNAPRARQSLTEEDDVFQQKERYHSSNIIIFLEYFCEALADNMPLEHNAFSY